MCEDNLICKICGLKCRNFKSLQSHVFRIHKETTSENYYKEFLLPENFDLKCPIQAKSCKKTKKFLTFAKGFHRTCGNKGCSYEQTISNKYGKHIKNYFQLNDFKKSNKEKNLKKYGVEYISQADKIKRKKEITRRKSMIPQIERNLKELNLELLSDYSFTRFNITLKCQKCGEIFKSKWLYLQQVRGLCPKCFPINISFGEEKLAEFLNSLGMDIKRNNRKIITPLELDIVVEDQKVAIEYCGLYWHGHKIKDKKYNINKLERCLEKGYRLLTIFEDEWLLKQDIVKARLKHILGFDKNVIKIRASECEIEGLEYNIKDEFLNKYHIQGKDRSRIKLGAYYKNELVSIMTFGSPSPAKGAKNSQEGIWELNRFCSHPDYHIYGIASKLLKYFQENFEWNEIFSYADRRWSDGNLYKQLGFNLVGTTNPNYWYWGKDIIGRAHRFNFRKSALKDKKMKYYNPDFTEFQIMGLEGYNWIYDCGSLKYALKR